MIDQYPSRHDRPVPVQAPAPVPVMHHVLGPVMHHVLGPVMHHIPRYNTAAPHCPVHRHGTLHADGMPVCTFWDVEGVTVGRLLSEKTVSDRETDTGTGLRIRVRVSGYGYGLTRLRIRAHAS